MAYRVYYSDGSVFDGPSESPPPRFNVQAILQRNEEGELHVRSGQDFYILEDGVWVEHNIVGLLTWLVNSGVVLFGGQLPNLRFADIHTRALGDLEAFDG